MFTCPNYLEYYLPALTRAALYIHGLLVYLCTWKYYATAKVGSGRVERKARGTVHVNVTLPIRRGSLCHVEGVKSPTLCMHACKLASHSLPRQPSPVRDTGPSHHVNLP